MAEFPKELRRVALYLRKSRADVEAEARGEGETLSRHRTALLKLAEKNRYVIKDTYEEIVSGERILDRPEMRRLLQEVHAGVYQAVLCMDVDRLGRGNMVDQGLIQEAFKASKTLIITPRKVYDLQDELDEEWSEFEAFMARRELKIITRRMQRGRRQSAGAGKSISRKPPYGYLRDLSLKLYPDPKTAPVVQTIFSMAADGVGMTRIANHLTSMGIVTPSGNSVWERSSIYAILKNPVYLGHITWGRMKYEKDPSLPSKYARTRQNPEDWIVTENAHEPLVSQETYERYLNRLAKTPKVSSKRELSNPLASLLYCGVCGKSMRRQQTYNRPTNRLLCPTYGCRTKSASFELVEERVLDTLRSILSTMVFETKQTDVRSEDTEAKMRVVLQTIEEKEATIRSLTTQKNRLHDLLEQGVYDVGTFVERNSVLETRFEEVKNQLQITKNSLEEIRSTQERQSEFVPKLLHVVSAYNMADDVTLKNEMMKSVIDKILFRRDAEARKRDEFTIEISLRL